MELEVVHMAVEAGHMAVVVAHMTVVVVVSRTVAASSCTVAAQVAPALVAAQAVRIKQRHNRNRTVCYPLILSHNYYRPFLPPVIGNDYLFISLCEISCDLQG